MTLRKIYSDGNSIMIEGIKTSVISINSAHFGWSMRLSNFYVRDKIENQSYRLGRLLDIKDKYGASFVNQAILIKVLNSFVNKSGVTTLDKDTQIIDLNLSKILQTVGLITNYNIDDISITIDSISEPQDNNIIELKEDSAFYNGKIISHSANGSYWDIILDTPLDFDFTTNSIGSEKTSRLNVNGSVTKQIFSISPIDLHSDMIWNITYIMLHITSNTPIDDTKFGNLIALNNGIIIRESREKIKNIFNAKTIGDLGIHMFPVIPRDTIGAGGKFVTRFRRRFAGQSQDGVVIRLNASTSDSLDVIIQDDLTSLLDFFIIAGGHVNQN